MKKFVAGAAIACALSALPCLAQEIESKDSPDAAARRAMQAANEAQYWAQEAARAADEDPHAVIRRRSAFKRANRIERLEARKWTQRSSVRPTSYLGFPLRSGRLFGDPWYSRASYHGVWGGSILGAGNVGYAESSRAPVLGLFGGLHPASYYTSR